jgi:hypothetical protein
MDQSRRERKEGNEYSQIQKRRASKGLEENTGPDFLRFESHELA